MTGGDKTISTLRARLALRGWSLHTSADHDGTDGATSYFATQARWGGHTRELADLAAVAAFVDEVSGIPTGWALVPPHEVQR